jgi:chaperonin GroEL (HSP60 family)
MYIFLVCLLKGLSDLASHYFYKAGISSIRRLRKSDNNRIARAVGATIVHRPEEIKEVCVHVVVCVYVVVCMHVVVCVHVVVLLF